MPARFAQLTEMPSEPIPLSVLTGFRGSGKTKLLSRVLALPDLRDAAVVVSEFGAVALDHLLLEASTDDVVELPNSCTCCVRLDRVVTKVDTVAGPATLDCYPEAVAQAADLLLLTKTDLAAIPEGSRPAPGDPEPDGTHRRRCEA